MPQQQPYPEEEVPPILPSTSDFQNVVSGFLNGYQQQGNLNARRAAYQQQQAQEQAQQQFENQQKIDAANLNKANALEKAAQDNGGFDYDAAHKEAQADSLKALGYVGQYHDFLASSQTSQAKAAAVSAYELSGGQYNPTGSTAALQDAYKEVKGVAPADIPTFYPGTTIQSGGAGYNKDMDPTQDKGASFSLKQMAGVIKNGSTAGIGDDDDSPAPTAAPVPGTTAVPSGVPAAPLDTSYSFVPGATTSGAGSTVTPSAQSTNAMGTPIVPPGSVNTANPDAPLTSANTFPNGPFSPAFIAVPPKAQPSADPTSTPNNIGTMLGPSAPPPPLDRSVLQGLTGGPGSPAQAIQGPGGAMVPMAQNAPVSATPVGQPAPGPITPADLAAMPSPAAYQPRGIGQFQAPFYGAGATPQQQAQHVVSTPATPTSAPPATPVDPNASLPPELRGDSSPRALALIQYHATGQVPANLPDGMDADDLKNGNAYYYGRKPLGNDEDGDPIDPLGTGGGKTLPAPAPWSPPASQATAADVAATQGAAYGNPFALADGHLTKDQLTQAAQLLHQQQIEQTAQRNVATLLQSLPQKMSQMASQPLQAQHDWAVGVNSVYGPILQVPGERNTDGSVNPPLSRDAGQIAKELYNKQNQLLQVQRLKLGIAGLNQRGSEFMQAYNQRQQFHADTVNNQNRDYGLKVNSLPGGSPQGASYAKDQATAVAATQAAARASAAVTANGGDPAKDANVQQLTAFAARAQAQANSDAQEQDSQDTTAGVAYRLKQFVGSTGKDSVSGYTPHHDGCADFAGAAFDSLGYAHPKTSSAAGLEKQLPSYGWRQTTTPGPGDAVFMYSASAPSHTHAGVVIGDGQMVNDTGGRNGPAVKESPIPPGARYYTYHPEGYRQTGPMMGKGPLTSSSVFSGPRSGPPPSRQTGPPVMPGFPAASNPIDTLAGAAAEMARRKRSRGQ